MKAIAENEHTKRAGSKVRKKGKGHATAKAGGWVAPPRLLYVVPKPEPVAQEIQDIVIAKAAAKRARRMARNLR